MPNFSTPGFKYAIDDTTRRWIRDASDERAAHRGYRMNEQRGQFTVDWVETTCVLYEGSKAGQYMTVEDDWQYDYFMRLMGWEWPNEATDVNRWVRRFVKCGVWIPKKNKKSPTLAATALYALCGDGEPGQKCYGLAVDREQVLISMQHAIEMIRQSPKLSRECSINNTTKIITHHPTASYYIPVASGRKKNKEGYNGSLFVDETHVVDGELMEIVERAGIVRQEPLHVEMSTAGDDPGGYGYQQYEYGRDVAEGLIEDDRYLYVFYGIDQQTTAEQLQDEEHVRSVIHIANPALKTIMKEEEIMRDWQMSRRSTTKLLQFARYRLNLWLLHAGFWLSPADWGRLEHFIPESDLNGFPSVLHIDLSETTDLTAITEATAVPMREVCRYLDKEYDEKTMEGQWFPYVRTWHFITKAALERYEHKVPFSKWMPQWIEKAGDRIIDWTPVQDIVADRVEDGDVRAIGYDRYQAKRFISECIYDLGIPEGMFVNIDQNRKNGNLSISELEDMILSERLLHEGNPLVEWQFGHVRLKRSDDGNRMVVKPDEHSPQKIDGLVTILNAVLLLCQDDTIRPDMLDAANV